MSLLFKGRKWLISLGMACPSFHSLFIYFFRWETAKNGPLLLFRSDYVVKVGERNALAYQLTRGGNVFGRPATTSGPGENELSLIDQLSELEGKITDPQMRLLDQANQLRFRILDLKIQQTLLHAAHNSDAADDLRMGRRRELADRTGARMAAILPADNEKARALKTQLGIPFNNLPAFEKGFGAEVGKMEALWELKLGLEAASKVRWSQLYAERRHLTEFHHSHYSYSMRS